MAITLRQESATGATTKGSALTYAELDNNFVHLLRQGSVTVRGDSGTDQTLGEPDKDSILQIAGGADISTTISSDSAGESVVTIAYTGSGGLADVVDDTTPQLGGDLDVNGNEINGGTAGGVTIAGGGVGGVANVNINSAGGGNVIIDSINYPNSDGSADQFIKTDGSGNLSFASITEASGSELENVVEDTTPQLGGSLDVNGNSIVSASGGDIAITPDGSGSVVIDGINYPQADGSADQFIKTDGAGQLSFASITEASGSELENVVEDTTPQLGGDLDCQGNKIQNPVLEDYAETIYSLGSTDTPTITVSNGNVQSVTITSGLTLPAFSDAATGQSVTLLVSGSGTASGTGSHKFAGGNTTLTTDSVVSIFYDGTTYWTSIATDFQ